ncbi:RimJ/RimL family protein N-acetyltransferase/8-oxo-dGTP pyrophosphatase MutT (NUDIX family) [Nocardioides sp. BE266]|uniref:NUDIX hydrolase n=1 Tax=Nocardioides sp. BE266 TaxID=2817725 RepID=UPI002860EA22|nr:GNAT family N-acetyltransferase [Nocardioides sp. BE266]MDR7251148.1 RimJ/RimL family protein N-acetyltransferase/8-oxo-dGTP pyrophosphatase MutT (NUDIX family) [Nocardioides sp. BE266]
MPDDQPTLTDGTITLRPWRDEDVAEAVAGHDDEMALWFGWDPADVTEDSHRRAIADWRADYAADRRRTSFVVEHGGDVAGSVEITRNGDAGASLSWTLYAGHRGHGYAARAVRVLVDWAFADADDGGLGLQRVEARIDPRNHASRRVATRAGLRLEGMQRIVPGMGDRSDATSYAVFARLVTDPPLSDPESFRSLLNSFLPRKRAISQMLVRDEDGRVLLCQLTYKRDWDLPGGVVEVGESPRLAVEREVEEELGLTIEPGGLVLTDWLPAWSGWDDAVCLVFDGGTHSSSILDGIVKQEREIRDARFCTLEEVDELAADFTARRIRAAVGGDQPYTESGR